MARWSVRTAAGLAAICALAAGASADDGPDWAPARRKDPFPSEQSYLILPLPYSIPGIGSGYFLTLYETNYVVPHRGYLLLIEGDAQGTILGLEQIQLVPRRLLLDGFAQVLSRAQINQYPLRGMDTGKSDFVRLELDKVEDYQWRLTYSLWERRFEAFVDGLQESVRITRTRNSSGQLVSTYAQPPTFNSRFYEAGLLFDFTDDFFDPRRGIRAETVVRDAPRLDSSQPDYFVINAKVNAYAPMGRQSTWAFSLLQSDAYVRRKGETDLAVLNQQNNQNCSGNPACQAAQAAAVANALAANTNGTAQPLGGDALMRAYPTQRFKGGHTLYFSSEFRWNLTDEFTPFNYLFFKDTRTAVQVAPFVEAGSVSETAGTLGTRWRHDYGVGVRMVTASGAAYRFDYAVGDEGGNASIIVNYPW
jgi:hypothetical protein